MSAGQPMPTDICWRHRRPDHDVQHRTARGPLHPLQRSPLTPTNLSNSGSPCPQLLRTGVSGSLPSSFGTLTWNGTGYVFYLIA